jgi:DnaJ homolog subfamily C member 17
MTSTFGPVDKDTIVLSIKPPKKAAAAQQQQHKHRPPKHATAAVPFKTVADAHAAVCASSRADRGLEEFEIGWMAGHEPAVWSWSERMMLRRSKEVEMEERPAQAPVTVTPAKGVDTAKGNHDGRTSSPGTSSQFSSFPSSFVRVYFFLLIVDLADKRVFLYCVQTGIPPSFPSSAPQLTAPGLDFESAVLMRMRKAERERIEREIREQEAGEA